MLLKRKHTLRVCRTFFCLSVLLCLSFGFAIATEKPDSKIQVTVKSEDSSVLFPANVNPADTLRLPDNLNTFSFSFDGKQGSEYSFRLSGLDAEWSEWTNTPNVSYANLPYGDYIFALRSKSDNLITHQRIPFKITAPWYKHTGAMVIAFLIIISMIYVLIQKKLSVFTPVHSGDDPISFFHPENSRIDISLQKEDLIAEVNIKNKELATITMHLVERGKLLTKIREDLTHVSKQHQSLTSCPEFRSVLRNLAEAENNRNDWEHFSMHFDDVHRNFLSELKSQFPILSTTDLKLCAYLRLNLSSKEIAQSMNITVKGVEVSRYRLRKKLNLAKEINLFDYLLQVTTSGSQKVNKVFSDPGADELASFLSFFNNSMTAKFISQGGYNFSSEGIFLKGSVSHNK